MAESNSGEKQNIPIESLIELSATNNSDNNSSHFDWSVTSISADDDIEMYESFDDPDNVLRLLEDPNNFRELFSATSSPNISDTEPGSNLNDTHPCVGQSQLYPSQYETNTEQSNPHPNMVGFEANSMTTGQSDNHMLIDENQYMQSPIGLIMEQMQRMAEKIFADQSWLPEIFSSTASENLMLDAMSEQQINNAFFQRLKLLESLFVPSTTQPVVQNSSVEIQADEEPENRMGTDDNIAIEADPRPEMISTETYAEPTIPPILQENMRLRNLLEHSRGSRAPFKVIGSNEREQLIVTQVPQHDGNQIYLSVGVKDEQEAIHEGIICVSETVKVVDCPGMRNNKLEECLHFTNPYDRFDFEKKQYHWEITVAERNNTLKPIKPYLIRLYKKTTESRQKNNKSLMRSDPNMFYVFFWYSIKIQDTFYRVSPYWKSILMRDN